MDPTLDEAAKRESVMSVVRGPFKPEFLNRLDEIVQFDALTVAELTRIVDLQVESLQARLTDRRLTLEVSDAAKAWLAEAGFDPAYGARPLRRAIQRSIENPLARRLLAGNLAAGGTMRIDVADGQLTFNGEPEAVPPRPSAPPGSPATVH